jgi:DNA polymerase V
MYGLLDCNNFFVSCERLFRPDLLKRPVAVLSSNDGCIVARSQEVKDLGIPMGVPYFKVKDLCKKEGVVLFSSNFTLYRDLSARVMSALREEASDAEVYSRHSSLCRKM